MMIRPISALAVTALIIFAGACAATTSTAPDEFRVVTKAPLSVPPNYSLRPPEVGEARPAELSEENTQRVWVFGRDIGVGVSVSEQILIARAQAISVSPVVRTQIDFEESGVLRKSNGVSDRVLDWEGNEEDRASAASDSATGGGEVVINRNARRQIKLPGT